MGDRLRFVFRNFPITASHPHAQQAAEAAEAAAGQGTFWEMHDLLFENRRHLRDQDLRGYAEQLGLDVERFEKSWPSTSTPLASARTS
jgi:formate-nitrite transporter family protein